VTPAPVRVRFAPSPTGLLHLGNARTALFNFLFARSRGGAFILRIEDTDAERSSRESEESIREDLAWLGLAWDEGPDVGGPVGPYRQSQRRPRYDQAAGALLAAGAAYACVCDPAELDARREAARREGRPYRYDGRCRGGGGPPGDRPWALRLLVPAGEVPFHDEVYGEMRATPAQYGDPILRRSDGSPAYNFAAPVDDAAMGITHVIRGEDHLTNTAVQVVVYRGLGLTPPAFAHLPMILGSDGARLSKRHGATSVSELRRAGVLPEALRNGLALLGWSHPGGAEVLSPAELIAAFDLRRVARAAATFDPAKLAWINGQWLRGVGPARLAQEILPRLVERGHIPADIPAAARDWLGRALELFVGGSDLLERVADRSEQLFRFDPDERASDPEVAGVLTDPFVAEVAEALRAALADRSGGSGPGPDLSGDGYAALVEDLRRRTSAKGRSLFHPLRILLTGYGSGPELHRLIPILAEGSRLPLSRPPVGPAERAAALLARQPKAPGG